jgi:hypothetical protein
MQDDAVSYAKSNCGSGSGLCAEFVSRCLNAGSAGNPIITWVPTLVQWLTSNGWNNVGNSCCGPAGAVVIYNDGTCGHVYVCACVCLCVQGRWYVNGKLSCKVQKCFRLL